MSFHTYSSLVSDLNNIVATDSNGISILYDLGTTHDSNHIYAICIGQDITNKSLFVGCHHAREWMSVEVPYLLAEYLVNNYNSDPLITALIDCRQIWIIPMLNPDGHEYSRTTSRMWRKNRNLNGNVPYVLPAAASLTNVFDATKHNYGPKNWEEIYDANLALLSGLVPAVSRNAASIVPAGTTLDIPCYGVDLNRNYDYQWGRTVNAYNSNQIDHPNYWGTPGSEPEVQIIKRLLNRTLPSVSSVIGPEPFSAAISYHTFGRMILYPWAYQNVSINDPITIALANGMSDLTSQAGARYTACYGICGGAIYVTFGDFQDWAWNRFNIPVYTFEMDTTHINTSANISRVFNVNLHAALALINTSHPSAQVSYNISALSSGSVYVRSGITYSPCDIAVGQHSWDVWGAGYSI